MRSKGHSGSLVSLAGLVEGFHESFMRFCFQLLDLIRSISQFDQGISYGLVEFTGVKHARIGSSGHDDGLVVQAVSCRHAH